MDNERLRREWRSDPQAADELYHRALRQGDYAVLLDMGPRVAEARKDVALFWHLWGLAWRIQSPAQLEYARIAAHWLHDKTDLYDQFLGLRCNCTGLDDLRWTRDRIYSALRIPEEYLGVDPQKKGEKEEYHNPDCPRYPHESSRRRDSVICWIKETTDRYGEETIAIRALLAHPQGRSYLTTWALPLALRSRRWRPRATGSTPARIERACLSALICAFSILGDGPADEETVVERAVELAASTPLESLTDPTAAQLRYWMRVSTRAFPRKFQGSPVSVEREAFSLRSGTLSRSADGQLRLLPPFQNVVFPIVRRVFGSELARNIVTIQPMNPEGYSNAVTERWGALTSGIIDPQTRAMCARLLENQSRWMAALRLPRTVMGLPPPTTQESSDDGS